MKPFNHPFTPLTLQTRLTLRGVVRCLNFVSCCSLGIRVVGLKFNGISKICPKHNMYL